MAFLRSKPREVFTPRASSFNPKMYIDRSVLEASLKKHLNGTRHVVVHGESGNGKTWLYKKVLSDLKMPYLVVNLANASRLGSLQEAFKDKVKKESPGETLSQKVVNRTTEANAVVLKQDYTDQKVYDVVEREPLEALMALLRREAGRKRAVIVLDNFEQILASEKLIKELSDSIVLLDDEDYASFDIRFCIVGVPVDIRDYLSKQSSIETISNRLVELPEVARLSDEEASLLLERGFREILKYDVTDDDVSQIVWKTDRIAQHLHEFGLEVSEILESASSRNVTSEILEQAAVEWCSSSLSAVKNTIDHNLNARDTRAGRRNQVIYSLGCIKTEDFKYTDVEDTVRDEFKDSTDGVILNVAQTLSQLEKSEFPLIKRVPKGDAYRMINPKIKIAIGTMLQKDGDGKATKIPALT